MITGNLYFIKDEFITLYGESGALSDSRGKDGGKRPFLCVFADRDAPNIYWLIPVSSRVEKYQKIWLQKMKQHGACLTLYFAKLFGKKRAFLIQDMFPITDDYILKPYYDENGHLARLPKTTYRKILATASAALELALHHNQPLLLSGAETIYTKLKLDISG